MKLQNPENKAFAQIFQKNYAGKILECHLNLLNVIRVGGYLPDRVINLILQYLSNRFENYYCVIFSYSDSLLAVVSLYSSLTKDREILYLPLLFKHVRCQAMVQAHTLIFISMTHNLDVRS